MPREAPVMNSVLPLSDMVPPKLGFDANGACSARLAFGAGPAYISTDDSIRPNQRGAAAKG
jgi:hypothetical protein